MSELEGVKSFDVLYQKKKGSEMMNPRSVSKQRTLIVGLFLSFAFLCLDYC